MSPPPWGLATQAHLGLGDLESGLLGSRLLGLLGGALGLGDQHGLVVGLGPLLALLLGEAQFPGLEGLDPGQDARDGLDQPLERVERHGDGVLGVQPVEADLPRAVAGLGRHRGLLGQLLLEHGVTGLRCLQASLEFRESGLLLSVGHDLTLSFL